MNRLSPHHSAWPLERVLFGLAGTVTLLSAVLSALVSPWFLLLTAFVGVNQWLYVGARACPASIVLKRACGLQSSLTPLANRLETAGVSNARPSLPAAEGPSAGRK
jgi:hypothetical protein